jgi:hypothetical protein
MSTKLKYRARVGALALCAGILVCYTTVKAQVGRQITISPPDVSSYPEITFYFDVTDRDGTVIGDLAQQQVTLRENGLEQDLVDFQALSPGIQLVAAFNISPPFAIQDINGNSRFDFIRKGLINWANQPLEGGSDDLSILSNDGLELTHLKNREDFIAALEAYQPDLKGTQANFNVLARAIEIASDPVTQPGMKKAVLLISSQPTAEATDALQSLISQASAGQVRIYTLLVSSAAFYTSAGATQLQNLSQTTGGQFLPFSGEEPLADFGQLFAPLRSTYLVQYISQVVTPGTQTLELSVATSLGESVGQMEFQLDVQPPNPVFVSPPRSIIRRVDEAGTDSQEEERYLPEYATLDVLVEFPDQHPRDLEELIFRVDGEVVDRKTSPPYDYFIWDLRDYKSSATHHLTLEAIDVMGLSQISLQTPIEVVVDVPPPRLSTIMRENALSLGGLGVILILGITLFILIARGKIHPSGDAVGRSRGKSTAANPPGNIMKRIAGKKQLDPSQEATAALKPKPFRLIAINDLARQLFPEPIRITDPEIVLGSAPGENGIIIRHESIIKEHTRITTAPGGKHLVTDGGSPAGTWINYQQIPSTKTKMLKDGDIIHIGEAGFRYQLLEGIIPERNSQETTH